MERLVTQPATPAHVAQMLRRVGGAEDMDLTRAWTCLVAGEPLCCFGLSPLWPGVALAWFLERDPALTRRYALSVCREVLGWWRVCAPAFRYVEALVMADRADSRRLIEWLGFVPVLTKVGYGPGGETMIEYAWRANHGP